MELSHLVEGHAQAAVRVEIFEDLACRDCAYLRRKLDDVLLPRYETRVAFVHYDFPLTKHVWAREAAVAARWMAREGGAALEVRFRRAVMAFLNEIAEVGFHQWMDSFLQHVGLSGPVAWEDAALQAAIDADLEEGRRRGVEKTPTVFLGNTQFVEWVPMPELMAAIDQAPGSSMEVTA